MQYQAFISYSHAADGKLASILQSALQRFAKPWYRLRALRVFRDATGLSANPALWPAIEQALGESEHFLLMASPRSAQSHWVAREIAWWLEHRSPDRLLVLLTDGELVWDSTARDYDWSHTTALPPLLQDRFADEPLYVDLRWAHDADDLSLRHSQFRRAVLDLAAPLHGRPKDELDGEDVRQYRRTRRLAAAAIVILTALTLATGAAAWYAVGQRRNAEQKTLEAEEARDGEEAQRKNAEKSERVAIQERDEARRQRNRADLKQREAVRERRNAEKQTGIAVAERAVAQHQARVALANLRAVQSRTMLRDGAPMRALLVAAEAVQVSLRAGDPRVPAAEDALWQALANTGGRVLGGHPKPVETVAVSPDAHWAVTASWDGTVQLWDLDAVDPGARPRRLPGHQDIVRSLTFSRDSRWLATVSDDKTARLWDLASAGPRSIVLGGHEGPVKILEISPDGRWLATGSDDHTARLWDLAAGAPATTARVLRGHSHEIERLAFSPDSRLLVTASRDAKPLLWDLAAGAASPIALTGHETDIFEVAFSPDGRWLASGDAKGGARLWDLKAAAVPAASRVLAGHRRALFTLRFSPDGRWLASGGGDPDVRLWDLKAADPAAAPILLPSGKKDDAAVSVLQIEFSPNGRWLATDGDAVSEAARLWDLGADTATPRLIRLAAEGAGAAQRIAFGGDRGDEERLVVSSRDAVRTWKLGTNGSPDGPTALRGHDFAAEKLALSQDGRWLVTAAAGEPIARLWDLTNPTLASNRVIDRTFGSVRRFLIRPDGRFLAGLIGEQPSLMVWDLRAEDIARTADSLPHDDVTAAAFTGDGRWLASAGQDGTVRLWDLDAQSRSAPGLVLAGHAGPVTCLASSPDGRWLATGGTDATLRLWDLRARDPAAASLLLRGHRERLYDLAFSPDGRWLFTVAEDERREDRSSSDITAQLWDLRARNPAAALVPLPDNEGKAVGLVTDTAFSPDGRWLAVKREYGDLLLWRLREPGKAPALIDLGEQARSVHKLLFSPDNRWLVTQVGGRRNIAVWDLSAQHPGAKPMMLHADEIQQMAFSPDGRRLATATSKGLSLWDLSAENPAGSSVSLVRQPYAFRALAFAPSGRWLVTSGQDQTVRLWDLDPKELVARACRVAGPNLTPDDWSWHFPGEPYPKTCPD